MPQFSERVFGRASAGICVDGQIVAGDWVGAHVRLPETWLDTGSSADFTILLKLDERRRLIRRAVVAPGETAPAELLAAAGGACDAALSEMLAGSGGVALSCDRPLRLATATVAKPWGREIWYTGIERRGVSGLAGFDGRAVPLPWLLRLLPQVFLGADGGHDPVLLKVLDPFAEAVFGDLYFELHERKHELYVVTRIDRRAWPGDTGSIRLGFDPAVVATFPSGRAFREAFLDSVLAYEEIRGAVDERLDACRAAEGIGADEPVLPDHLRTWLGHIDPLLLREETRCRQAMERFTATRPLGVGDVVAVEPLTPHSLLHGVRTVEFQTPVYERKILAFAQKVLTQRGWDSDEAVAMMRIEPPPVSPPVRLCGDAEAVLERLARFDTFDVERLHLERGGRFELDGGGRYLLLLAVDGAIECGSTALAPEEACLVPAQLGGTEVVNDAGRASAVLIARPTGAGH